VWGGDAFGDACALGGFPHCFLQPGAIEQLRHEQGCAGHLRQHALHLIAGEHSGQALRFFGHDRADRLFDGCFEDVVVEEENGAEGLVLGGGGYIAVDGQVGEEGFDVGRSHVAGMDVLAGVFFVEEDEAFDPADVGLFGAIGIVLAAEGVTQLVQESGLGGIITHVI